MRSADHATDTGAWTTSAVLTGGESSFRNAKLRNAALVVYKAAADAAAKGSLFVITLAAARRLAPWAFGVFALGSTVGWMLSVAADFGLQLHLARIVSREPDAAHVLLRRWIRVRVASTAIACAVVPTALVVARVDLHFALPFSLFVFVYGVNGLIEFLYYFYRGLSRSDVESSLTLWQRGATLVLALAALAWRPDVSLLAAAMLVPAVVTLAWSTRLAMRLEQPPPIAVDRQPLSLAREFQRDVFPIGFGAVLSALYFRIDLLLVGWWAGTEAVARYNAVFRLIEALRLFPAAVLAVMLPALCRAADRRPLVRVSALVTSVAVAATAVLWATADWLVPLLYGAAYRAAVPTFRVLTLSFPLLSLNFALTHQLLAWNRQRAYAILCAIALAANVALNMQLIPALSTVGAAWATLGTEALLTIGCLAALR
jgi:O-antigen/teichoic acid export membrane protein